MCDAIRVLKIQNVQQPKDNNNVNADDDDDDDDDDDNTDNKKFNMKKAPFDFRQISQKAKIANKNML